MGTVGMARVARRLPLLLLWACLIVVLTPLVRVAIGAQTEHRALPQWGNQGDWIIPWDFTTKSSDPDHVDWAVDVLFLRNANIERVKADMQGDGENTYIGYSVGDDWYERGAADPMNGVMNENDLGNNQWHWREDRGMKTNACAYGNHEFPWGKYNVLHYRIYAPNGRDSIFNQGMGWWVYGTTHIDHKECVEHDWAEPPYLEGKWSGRSELAEKFLASLGRYYFGNRHVLEDVISMNNGENRQDTGHWWENNGKATVIEVCLKNGGVPCDATASAAAFISTSVGLTIDQVLHGSPAEVSVHGTLTSDGYSMANKQVEIEFDNADVSGWRTDRHFTATTDGSGYYEYRDYSIAPGNWNIRARYSGTEEFRDASTSPQFRRIMAGYHIVNRNSGQCLSLSEGWKNFNGQHFIQWDCSGSPSNGDGQVFSFWPPYGGGWYELRANGKNRCLSVAGGSGGDGAALLLWDCAAGGAASQQWRREPIQGENDRYALMPKHTYPNKCADVSNSSFEKGADVIQWQCHWKYNQRWALVGVINP